MICTLSYRGVFRQEQYETATIEGSITVDTDRDLPAGDIRGPDELAGYMTDYLDRLLRPSVDRVAESSRYSEDETVIYEWKGMLNGTSDEAPERQPRRRIRQRD